PCSSTPLPLIEMSCVSDCGFIDFSSTVPAFAVAVVFVKARPLWATSISTTCALAGVDPADDEPPPPPDPPQPAASTAATATVAAEWSSRIRMGANLAPPAPNGVRPLLV